MLKRILLVLSLCGTVSYAAADPVSPASGGTDNSPTEASIKHLLEAGNAHKLVDSMMVQMDTFMRQAMQQATQGKKVSPKMQKGIDKGQTELMAALKEMLAWEKLEPMYVRIYQKTLNQQEVNGMITFYESPAGLALINKMPLLMQNIMNEMQQMMSPMMQRIERMQQDVVAELKAEDKKKGG